MRSLWVRHIQDSLKEDFTGHMDLSDQANSASDRITATFLSRALAARAVQRFTGMNVQEAGNTVVDGFGDNGLDAVAVDKERRQVILVQSKWDNSGDSGLSLGDALKFIKGCQDLFNMEFDRFSDALKRREEEIAAALSEAAVTFMVVVATTGRTKLPTEARMAFDDFLNEMNENDPVVSLELLGLQEFHDMVVEGTAGPRINVDVPLEQWGVVEHPYLAYYGVLPASELARWYESYGDRLFSQNIRKSLGNTEVNDGLTNTLLNDAGHFWYFNNGVTALCSSIKKTPRGGATHTFGDFAVEGLRIVNGAQTVTSIHRASVKSAVTVDGARVWVRFISLEDVPADFGTAVTRATNTQNSVGNRDFVSLDPEQTRLRTDMRLSMGKTYAFKRGEDAPSADEGCSFEEALIALACAYDDPSYAVLAKGNIGRLSEDIKKAPYTRLFNRNTTAHRIWRCVQVMRTVESDLQRRRKTQLSDRDAAIAMHGNRVVLHLVFKCLSMARVDDPNFDWDQELQKIEQLTRAVLYALFDAVEQAYPNSYLAPLFKNSTKCRDLIARVWNSFSDNT